MMTRGDRAITGAGAVTGGGCWYYRKPPVPLPGTHTTGHTSHTWYTCHCSPYLPLVPTPLVITGTAELLHPGHHTGYAGSAGPGKTLLPSLVIDASAIARQMHGKI